ncbi:MAG: acyl-ACP--UDP-N-acetylglucosamine O-acyltransferase [Fimbriimonadaceae bacterium]|nr:acyl-ACP--UDP-N-acetylglucosamine O-acyltransferase [Fimbriimonadaceae bacterium]
MIHPAAVVEPGAELGADVQIGPFCHVKSGAVIGEGTVLDSHVTIFGNTTIGRRNRIAQGAVIGGDPQDAKFSGEPTYLYIGDDNTIREYVTLHRATGEGNATTIGDRNYIMAFVHLGHNGRIMNDVTIANGVGLSGHVTVEDRAVIGGLTGVHQFARIGRLAMVGGMSKIVMDCPPFMISGGIDQQVYDINAVGLRRIGIALEVRTALHRACKLLFKSSLTRGEALEIISGELQMHPEVQELIAFMERMRQGKNGRGDQR